MGKADDPREVPKGSYAAGDRVRIPNGAEDPLTVFINGVEQREGTDYEIEGQEVRFVAPILKEEINTGRWLAMYLGFFGTYRKDEKVDLQFNHGGKIELRSDVPVIPFEQPAGQ
ncbi:MAG: hypothetical protein JST31_15780 [Actinobacteria bacterium]|nr:hypothetical protein [Actinomycetota bacterium]